MAWVVWFTGLPGCGKTTVAQRVKERLYSEEINVKILQLDEIRRIITPNPKYTDEERDMVYASLGYMAKLLADVGTNVIVDATANRRRYRDAARKIIPDFAEVYVRAPLDTCIQREAARKAAFSPQGIYKKAADEGAQVPGVNAPYEEPLSPEIVVDTALMEPEDSARYVESRIREIFSDKRDR